ncbi:MAG: hypothetical protein F6J93_38500 [Oscillatoria sp. SIO1A7]|nr:hypothetical protein [Oscillatoria sp. SIO1A7]
MGKIPPAIFRTRKSVFAPENRFRELENPTVRRFRISIGNYTHMSPGGKGFITNTLPHTPHPTPYTPH